VGEARDPAEDGVAPRLHALVLTGRAREAAGPDGRPALPRVAGWPIFPFETEGLRVRTLEDPVLPEPPRRDEDAATCTVCARPDDAFVWCGDRWRISLSPAPGSLPTLVLHPRDHVDFADLTEQQGAEMGVLLVRMERALASIGGVGRVHVYKWGDGGAHLHVLVVARPGGMMQLRGMFLSTWMDVLPPLPAEEWAALRSHLAARLAEAGLKGAPVAASVWPAFNQVAGDQPAP